MAGRWVIVVAGIVGVVAACLASACGEAGAKRAGAGRPRVVATVAMVADLARAVGGERVEVVTLMGEGVDPHLYKATRDDVAKLASADLVLANGLLLEGKLTDALERVRAAGRAVVMVADALPRDQIRAGDHGEKSIDPHAWMDPVLWRAAVPAVREALTAIDPAGREAFAAGAAALEAELDGLHAYAAGVLATVPEGARVLATAHDAFGYFGRRYGFEVVGIQGISTESEAGVRDLERIVSLLVSRRVPAVFVETTVSDRNVGALIAGCGAQGHGVRLGGRLFSDAMGAPGTYEGTYVGMIDHNVTTIATALGGTAPARGWKGRLAGTGAEPGSGGVAINPPVPSTP